MRPSLRPAALRPRGDGRHRRATESRAGAARDGRAAWSARPAPAGRRAAALVAAAVGVAAVVGGAVVGGAVVGGATEVGVLRGLELAAQGPVGGRDRGVADVRGGAAAERSTRPVAAGPDVSGPTPADFRAVPLPQVVDAATVGPLWLTPQDRAAGVLALEVPPTGSGVLEVVPGSSPAPGTTGVRSVRVEVERDLAVDGAAFAATVMSTLNDPRGWGARGDVSFARTDGPADIRVVLATPGTTDALCAPLPTGGEVSCGRNGHAALNARRWVLATPEFADRTLYRHYLVNHEVGHLLGHPHQRCPGPGVVAPLMQQQSLRVAPCTPNGWPFPQG